MSRKPTKSELEYYANAKPRTREIPGYWKGDELKIGRLYSANLGTKGVIWKEGFISYVDDAGAYRFRSEALEAAKKFQAKARELLANGEYRDGDA